MLINCPFCREDLELLQHEARGLIRCVHCDGDFDPGEHPLPAFQTIIQQPAGSGGLPFDEPVVDVETTEVIPPVAISLIPTRPLPQTPSENRPGVSRPDGEAHSRMTPPPLPRRRAVALHSGPITISVVSLAVIFGSLFGMLRLSSEADGSVAGGGLGTYACAEIASNGLRTVVVKFVGDESTESYVTYPLQTKEYQVALDELLDGATRFNPEALAAVRIAVEEFADACRKEGLPQSRFKIITGSGLLGAFADTSSAKDAERVLSEMTLSAAGATLQVLSPEQETKCSALACVKHEDRLDTMFIDIGSGDIKGGYYTKSGFNYVKVLGTGLRAFRNAVTHQISLPNGLADMTGFRPTATRLRFELIDRPLFELQEKNSPILKSRDRVIMIGGAAWALATLSKPIPDKTPRVQVTVDDFRKFEQLLADLPDSLDALSVRNVCKARILGPLKEQGVVGTPAEIEVNKVLDVFDGPKLVAAGMTLAALNDIYQLSSKRVDVYRHGLYAVPIGFLIESSGIDK